MKRVFVVIVVAAVSAFALASRAPAQTTLKQDRITPLQDVSGIGSYNAYCRVCHGVGGKGDGPAAKALKVPPADLTQIAKRHGGKFSQADVRVVITGETVIAAHGTREMPMWGPLFASVDSDPQRALRVKNLVDYLEKIQER